MVRHASVAFKMGELWPFENFLLLLIKSGHFKKPPILEAFGGFQTSGYGSQGTSTWPEGPQAMK